MVLSITVMGAGAAYQDQDQIKHKEAVEKLASLNIMEGRENGNFDPKTYVTRAEMCKMICIALNGGKDPVVQALNPPTYWDTKGHWAAGYIEYCNAVGIVDGTGNGAFQPDASVTGVQAAKMMLAALGYKTDYTGSSWALFVSIDAVAANLNEQLEEFDSKQPLSRDDAAQLIYNGIMASTVTYGPIPTGKSMYDTYYQSQTPDSKH
jgi:hypothetical protein